MPSGLERGLLFTRPIQPIAPRPAAIPFAPLSLKVGDHLTLIFTKVMDELSRGLVDEDEDAEAAPTDRAYWEKKGAKSTVQLADQLLGIAREIDPSLEPEIQQVLHRTIKGRPTVQFCPVSPT
jgi:hypothetical protein